MGRNSGFKSNSVLNVKITSYRKKNKVLSKFSLNNLSIKEMLKILEQANLNSKEEIIDLELLENKLVNELDINNSIQASLENYSFLTIQ